MSTPLIDTSTNEVFDIFMMYSTTAKISLAKQSYSEYDINKINHINKKAARGTIIMNYTHNFNNLLPMVAHGK